MGKSEYKVSELVAKIERGELQLPEMQRKYVWTSTKVRDLLDSLYRGYPSGVILTWQPATRVETQDFAVATRSEASGTPLLLLDGQQRLTSLSAVLRGEPVQVRSRKRPVEILFNLDHPDELTFITEVDESSVDDNGFEDTDDVEDDLIARANRRAFVVSSNQVLALQNWVRVTDVFTKNDGEILQNAGVSGFNDPMYERYSARLKQLRAIAEYEYRVDILEPTKSYEEVTEIFVRVNSLGAKLRSSDLALAQITAKWNGSLALFTAYQTAVAKEGFDLDLGIHLRALVAVITGQSRFLTVSSLTKQNLEGGWGRTKRAMHFAINYVKSNFQIDSPTLLSSPFLLVAVAYWGHQRDFRVSEEDAATMRKWFLVANAKGRYSHGSSESLLDQDLAAIRAGGGGQLIQRLVQQAYLKQFRSDLDARKVDDIVNLAFIGSKTNKEIRDRAPRDYVGEYPPERLAAQLICFDDNIDVADEFDLFVERRRKVLARHLNMFLDVVPE
ncbi:hypothetical protein PLESTB_001978800 [Pleodorina starrii]|uniref:GmrSD restriction endonucleases N-terminal domain-containing protein n=1 Tax=Pleodorina starrii TaxID=330485 RepID=A0A9W6C3B5_9CHLO|nr:hypothetical protein PLESTB_001978800 [Pleodorina starrii]